MTNLKDKLHERVFVPVKNDIKVVHRPDTKLLDYLERLGHIDENSVHTPSDQFIIQNESLISVAVLQQKELSYLLTPLELLELRKQWAEEIWEAAIKREQEDFYYMERGFAKDPNIPDKETYINSLTL